MAEFKQILYVGFRTTFNSKFPHHSLGDYNFICFTNKISLLVIYPEQLFVVRGRSALAGKIAIVRGKIVVKIFVSSVASALTVAAWLLASHADVLRLITRSSWGGTRDKPNNVCVGGYMATGLFEK